MQPSPTSRKDAARPWLFGAIFVWALTGAVAWAAFSSRAVPTSPAISNPDLSAFQDPTGARDGKSAARFELPDAPKTSVPASAFANGIAWETSFEDAMQRARKENLPLMIDFYTDWCSACKLLDQEVYPNPKVIQETKKWVSIRIDAEKRPDVAGAYGVTGYPTIVFARKNGAPLLILPGFLPAPGFLGVMKQAHQKLD